MCSLQLHFKDTLVFVNKPGKLNVVTQRAKAIDLLHDNLKKNNLVEKEKETNSTDQRKEVLLAAAKIIK